MNAEVGRQGPDRLPPWILEEVEWRRYGGLDVGLVGRRTLIALKLYATVDRDRRSVHFQDLLALGPTEAELEESRRWVVAQDAGPLFAQLVEEVVANVRSSRP